MVTSLTPRGMGRGLFSAFGRDPFRALHAEIDDMISRFAGQEGTALAEQAYMPSLDVSETDGELQIKMDVPGIKPEEVEVNGNTLRVRGEHKEEKEEKGRTYHRVARRSFFRSVDLPCEVKQDKVVADYKDGVLKITLPKSEVTKPHKVAVKANGK